MTRMRFDPAITVGNILTLAILGGGGLMAYAEVRSETNFMREQIIEMRREEDAKEIRLRTLEMGFGRVDERLSSIQNDIQRLLRQAEQDRQGAN